MINLKFDFNDISLIPTTLSFVKYRKDINIFINEKLPIFVSPMDTVVDENNYKFFLEIGFEVCIPRGINIENDNVFISYGLDEIEELIKNNNKLPKKVLIDIANGHSIRVFELSKLIKEKYNIELMIGNIANPLTFEKYCEIGVDYVRCGIGAGHACTTSANSSIHYPMASLIKECYDIKKRYNYNTKIIADGGFKNYDDIIKAIGLGANYVMLGSIINKSIESCGDSFIKKENDYLKIDNNDAISYFKEGIDVYKIFRGMSTKEVQRKWGKKELKTSEGISKFNKVEYNISKWSDNFKDYLKSCLSYQGVLDIKDFIGEAEFVHITPSSFNRFNK